MDAFWLAVQTMYVRPSTAQQASAQLMASAAKSMKAPQVKGATGAVSVTSSATKKGIARHSFVTVTLTARKRPAVRVLWAMSAANVSMIQIAQEQRFAISL